MTIQLSKLLWLYWIVPLFVTLALLDQYVFDSVLLRSIPYKPEMYPLWVFLFGMPHVMAGINMFAEKEYFNWQGKRLVMTFIVCLIGVIWVGEYLGNKYLSMTFMLFIIYHTISQQFGITLAALKQSESAIFLSWKWFSIGVGGIIYTLVYTEPLPIIIVDNGWKYPLQDALKYIVIGAIFSGAVLAWQNRKNHLGVIHIAANTAMIVAEAYLCLTGYCFLAIVVGRIIHEFTAWPIYVAHDIGRNLTAQQNVFHKMCNGNTQTRIALITIGAAFVMGFLVQGMSYISEHWVAVITALSIYHYYTEHYLWRRDSALRKNLSFIS